MGWLVRPHALCMLVRWTDFCTYLHTLLKNYCAGLSFLNQVHLLLNSLTSQRVGSIDRFKITPQGCGQRRCLTYKFFVLKLNFWNVWTNCAYSYICTDLKVEYNCSFTLWNCHIRIYTENLTIFCCNSLIVNYKHDMHIEVVMEPKEQSMFELYVPCMYCIHIYIRSIFLDV